ncbi:DJ-1/PfpI family protein [Aerococcaceae bacterium DSM 111020]|nr:DJ-1/PfpI family protein [Aerococcaceae bacterium DSM 111020]
MKKIAVLLAPGFEEIEALTPVDVFRRAELVVDMIGFSEEVTGSHNITVKADKIITETDFSIYDLIVIPGGLPGATNLRDDERVIEALQEANDLGKKTAAICAGPIVLSEAGLLKGKSFTNAPGFEEEIEGDTHHANALVVVDGSVTTSRGAATALEFSYQLLEELGIDSNELREAMQYNKLVEQIKDNG